MIDSDILAVLKVDLQIQISAVQYDDYLKKIIALAKDAIAKEGIILGESVSDGMLVEMYAAYLYRRRKEENVAMPRSLRYALNNRLFSQKGSA